MDSPLAAVLAQLDELERLLPGLALLYPQPEALRDALNLRLQDILRDPPSDGAAVIASRVDRLLRLAAALAKATPMPGPRNVCS